MITTRIYDRCPSCGNDTLTVNDDHLAASWQDTKRLDWLGRLRGIEINWCGNTIWIRHNGVTISQSPSLREAMDDAMPPDASKDSPVIHKALSEFRAEINYDAPTPETDAFILLIDDSEIDLGQVRSKLSGMECERDAARRETQQLQKTAFSAQEMAKEIAGKLEATRDVLDEVLEELRWRIHNSGRNANESIKYQRGVKHLRELDADPTLSVEELCRKIREAAKQP